MITAPGPLWRRWLFLFAIGVISILGQVILLRELSVTFYGSELITILALGMWLGATALGAALRRPGFTPRQSQVATLLLATALLLPALVILARALRPLFGAMPGTYLGFGEQLAGILMVLLPAGVTLGLLFQWAARLYVGSGRLLALAYGIESLGGLVGGALATGFVYAGLQNLGAVFVCSLLAVAANYPGGSGIRARHIAVTGGLLVGLALSPELNRATTQWNHPNLVFSRDSPYARITTTRLAEQISVYQNDALAFESEGIQAETLVHLAALQHPKPSRVLILGGALSGTVAEVLKHNPDQVDAVELDDLLYRQITPFLPPDRRRPLQDPRVHWVFADPRAFLAVAGKYDLILVGMPEPESGQANRFFTREFFALAATRLRVGGLLGLTLPGAENLWTPLRLRQIASIQRGLDDAFAHTMLLPGTTTLLLASNRPLSQAPEPLSARFRQRQLHTRLISIPYIEYTLTNDRNAELASKLVATEVATNSDATPVCYQLTLMLWLSRFFVSGILSRVMAAIASPAMWATTGALMVAIALFLWWARRRPRWQRLILAGVAGMAGMVLETVLLLNYQGQRGVLYADLGLLLTLFMAGLAAGGYAADRWARRRPGSPALTRGYGLLWVAFFVLLCLGLAALANAQLLGGIVGHGALLFASGFAVAGLFSYATLLGSPKQAQVVAPVYASDLVGGCLGCLLGTLLLIPMFGMVASTLLIAGLLAIAAVAV